LCHDRFGGTHLTNALMAQQGALGAINLLGVNDGYVDGMDEFGTVLIAVRDRRRVI
jgi:hypothetical protein